MPSISLHPYSVVVPEGNRPNYTTLTDATQIARLHTFQRGHYRLWADRVPAMHGRVNLFTLWDMRADAKPARLIGGVTMARLRRYLREQGK